MLMLGQLEPSGMNSGSCRLPSNQGQPLLPGGEGGSSARVGGEIMISWNKDPLPILGEISN